LTHNENHHTEGIHVPILEAFSIFQAERNHAQRTYTSHVYQQIVKMAMYLQGIIKSEFADTHHHDCTDTEDFVKKYNRYLKLINQAHEDATFPEPTFFSDGKQIYRYYIKTSRHIIPPNSDPTKNDTYLLFFPFKLRHIEPRFLMDFLGCQAQGYGEGFDVFLRAYLIEWEANGLVPAKNVEICKVWLDEKPDWKASETPKRKAPSKEKHINIALEHIAFLGGENIQNQKIMKDEDFERLKEYVTILILDEKIPDDIEPFPTLNIGNGYIKYTFYLIHKELYTIKPQKPYFVEFLKITFRQFENAELSTIKAKFAQKPTHYDSDMQKMRGLVG